MVKWLTKSELAKKIAAETLERKIACDKIIAQPKKMPKWMRDELNKEGKLIIKAEPKLIIKLDNGQPVAFRYTPYKLWRLELQ